jgi:asparagine N-glycosylation enzyme membrane subunit Stt3
VFGIVFVTAILTAIASGIIQSIFSFLGSFLRYWLGGAIASAIVGPFFAVALTLTYFRLRELKDGVAAVSATLTDTPAPEAPPAPDTPSQSPTGVYPSPAAAVVSNTIGWRLSQTHSRGRRAPAPWTMGGRSTVTGRPLSSSIRSAATLFAPYPSRRRL